MNNNMGNALIMIALLFLACPGSIVTAESNESPSFPMILSGTVIDSDSNTVAPEGSILTAKDSGTDNVLGTTTVGANGEYGDVTTNKLIVNKPTTSSFDLYITIDGTEIKVGTFDWSSGVAKRINIEYFKDTSNTDSSSSGSSYSSKYTIEDPQSSTGNNAVAGGSGIEAPTDSVSQEESNAAPPSTNEGKGSSTAIFIIALIAIIIIVAFVLYRKS